MWKEGRARARDKGASEKKTKKAVRTQTQRIDVALHQNAKKNGRHPRRRPGGRPAAGGRQLRAREPAALQCMEERGWACAGRAGGRVRAAPHVPPPPILQPCPPPSPPSTTLSPLPFSPPTPQDEAVRLVIEECHEHNALMQEIIQCVKRDAGVGRAALVGVPRLERKRGPAWGGFRKGGGRHSPRRSLSLAAPSPPLTLLPCPFTVAWRPRPSGGGSGEPGEQQQQQQQQQRRR